MRDSGSDTGGPGVPFSTVAGALVVAVAIGGAAYMALSAPESPPASTESPDEPVDEDDPGTDGLDLSTPEVTEAADVSAERRAWDAAVNRANIPPATPTAEPLADRAASFEDVVGRVMPAVVLVEASGGRGSAFFVSSDTLLTNVHVVGDDATVTLRRFDGSTTLARVESRTPAFDIAVLKVSAPLRAQAVISMGSANALRVGQDVFMVGSALGTLQNSVTRGIVSGLRRSGEATLVQTDAAANPGNSGGPLMDRFGTAVGITTMGYTKQQGITFAVAIDHAQSIMEGRVRPAAAAAAPAWEAGRALSPALPPARGPSEDGARVFAAGVQALARAADQFDGEWTRFRQACYTAPIGGVFDREWFALFSSSAMPAPIARNCDAYVTNVRNNADRFRNEMRKVSEAARRAGVLPGVVRDTLRTHRLQFDGWDR